MFSSLFKQARYSSSEPPPYRSNDSAPLLTCNSPPHYTTLKIKTSTIPRWNWPTHSCQAWLYYYLTTNLAMPAPEAHDAAVAFDGNGSVLYTTTCEKWEQWLGPGRGEALWNILTGFGQRRWRSRVPRGVVLGRRGWELSGRELMDRARQVADREDDLDDREDELDDWEMEVWKRERKLESKEKRFEVKKRELLASKRILDERQLEWKKWAFEEIDEPEHEPAQPEAVNELTAQLTDQITFRHAVVEIQQQREARTETDPTDESKGLITYTKEYVNVFEDAVFFASQGERAGQNLVSNTHTLDEDVEKAELEDERNEPELLVEESTSKHEEVTTESSSLSGLREMFEN